jgi:hypothetical protein
LKNGGYKNGINNLRPIVEGQSHNWRSENVSEYTKQTVKKYFSEQMNPYDAAALFWFVRNRLFFEMDLDKNQDVMTCKYDELIDDPLRIMRDIYRFVGYVIHQTKLLSMSILSLRGEEQIYNCRKI